MEYVVMLSFILIACLFGIGYLGGQNGALTNNTAAAINKSLAPAANRSISSTAVLVGSLDAILDDDGTGDGSSADKSKKKANAGGN